jgi:hypothetical protein
VRARVIVHSLDHAAAALAAAEQLEVPVTLLSAPGAGGYAGPRWFLAVCAEAARAHPGAAFDAVVDCAGEPGTVLAALRGGAKRVRFTGTAEARRKLAAIAADLGAEIEGESQSAALDLLGERDPVAACRVYLGA